MLLCLLNLRILTIKERVLPPNAKIFITSNNKQIGKILFDCNTIEWEIE